MTPPAMETGGRPEERRCAACGDVLPPSPVLSCRSLACLAARPAADEARRRERRRAVAVEALEAAGLDPDRTPWSLVPFQGAPQVPVPAEQRAGFLAHLRRVAEGWEGRPGTEGGGAVPEVPPQPATMASDGSGPAVPSGDTPRDAASGDAAVDPALEAALEVACGQCRGWCCRKGRRHHAFLDGASLARFREGKGEGTEFGAPPGGGLGPDEIVALYASHIGDTHVEGSCVFHGPQGCRLPRVLRSPTCNDFFCPPLAALREGRVAESRRSGARVFVAVSAEAGREPRLGSLRVVATESPSKP